MDKLLQAEKKIYSQNGEDGVIQKLLDIIGIHNHNYVEIGCGNGDECNTRHLRENMGFRGHMFDMRHGRDSLNLHRVQVMPDNINYLLQALKVPKVFDVLSIDIDMHDFHVWRAVMKRYRPRIVVIEYNAAIPFNKPWVVPFDPAMEWAKHDFYGAGILAMTLLGWKCGYSLVYREARGVNLFFVHNKFAAPFAEWSNDVQLMYKKAKHHAVYTGPRKYDDAMRLLKIEPGMLPPKILSALNAEDSYDNTSKRTSQDLGLDLGTLQGPQAAGDATTG